MNSPSSLTKVCLHPVKGRAVVATQAIASDEIIDIAPVISFSAKTREMLKATEIFQYCFVDPKTYVRKQPNPGYLVLGMTTLCNHSDNPNAFVRWSAYDVGRWVSLIALKTIEPDEEIVISYSDIEEYDGRCRFES